MGFYWWWRKKGLMEGLLYRFISLGFVDFAFPLYFYEFFKESNRISKELGVSKNSYRLATVSSLYISSIGGLFLALVAYYLRLPGTQSYGISPIFKIFVFLSGIFGVVLLLFGVVHLFLMKQKIRSQIIEEIKAKH